MFTYVRHGRFANLATPRRSLVVYNDLRRAHNFDVILPVHPDPASIPDLGFTFR